MHKNYFYVVYTYAVIEDGKTIMGWGSGTVESTSQEVEPYLQLGSYRKYTADSLSKKLGIAVSVDNVIITNWAEINEEQWKEYNTKEADATAPSIPDL